MNSKRTQKVLSIKLKEHPKCRPKSIWEQEAKKDAMRKVLKTWEKTEEEFWEDRDRRRDFVIR